MTLIRFLFVVQMTMLNRDSNRFERPFAHREKDWDVSQIDDDPGNREYGVEVADVMEMGKREEEDKEEDARDRATENGDQSRGQTMAKPAGIGSVAVHYPVEDIGQPHNEETLLRGLEGVCVNGSLPFFEEDAQDAIGKQGAESGGDHHDRESPNVGEPEHLLDVLAVLRPVIGGDEACHRIRESRHNRVDIPFKLTGSARAGDDVAYCDLRIGDGV